MGPAQLRVAGGLGGCFHSGSGAKELFLHWCCPSGAWWWCPWEAAAGGAGGRRAEGNSGTGLHGTAGSRPADRQWQVPAEGAAPVALSCGCRAPGYHPVNVPAHLSCGHTGSLVGRRHHGCGVGSPVAITACCCLTAVTKKGV